MVAHGGVDGEFHSRADQTALLLERENRHDNVAVYPPSVSAGTYGHSTLVSWVSNHGRVCIHVHVTVAGKVGKLKVIDDCRGLMRDSWKSTVQIRERKNMHGRKAIERGSGAIKASRLKYTVGDL